MLNLQWRAFVFSSLLLGNAAVGAMTQAQQQAMTPEQALNQLHLGNQHFLSRTMEHAEYQAIVPKLLAPEQFPLGVIFSCMDSRSVPDILFDQDLGNIFGLRMAGNVADKNIVGSMEYAVVVTGAKVIVVLGHSQCGAVKGACMKVKLGNLSELLEKMSPAVKKVKNEEGKAFNCSDNTTLDAIAKQNVLEQMHYILKHSEIINKAIQAKQVTLVGAMHHLATGNVEFFDGDGQPL